jgi:very-short-patch-repair endonuclease
MTRRPDFDHRLLAEMLRKQRDVVTRRQTVDCGMTDKAFRYLGEVRAVVADSVQRRWCRVAELAGELRRGPVTGSAYLRQVLAEAADGIRSSAEADFRDLVKRAGLPMPMFNARLYVGEAVIAVADAWWPEAAVAAEVDSREWHLSPGDWERTLRRHARLTAHGILMLHFTPKQVRTEPDQVAAAIRAALDAARADRQSRVRALPASA